MPSHTQSHPYSVDPYGNGARQATPMTTTPGSLLHAIKRKVFPYFTSVSGNIHKAGLNAIGACPTKHRAPGIVAGPLLFCPRVNYAIL
jgi:hypothetical protein